MPTNLQGCGDRGGGAEIKGKRLISDYEGWGKLKKGDSEGNKEKGKKNGLMMKKRTINVGL